MGNARFMSVDVLKAPQDRQTFAHPKKMADIRRPALQEEMTRAVPEWKDIT